MSYLRLLMPTSRRRRLRRTCEKCGRTVFRFEAFCPYCGSSNRAFDEIEFERLALTTIETVRAHDCAVDPLHTTEWNAVNELRDNQIRWCTVCGATLPKRPSFNEL